MSGANWGAIHLLWLLSLVPVLVIAYAFDGQRRRRVLERIGNLPMLKRMTASWSPARRRWRAVLTVSAVALLVVALAQPQMQGKPRLSDLRGLDLVVALDFSKSMLARDVYPSRLERAKAELNRLIDTLKGDRLGLVAFAGETLSYPLTIDYEAAKLFWRDLQPDDMPVGGTDLGRAIHASVALLSDARAAEVKRRPHAKRRPAQVVLLLTDGEDTEGRGIAEAKEAAKAGIKIFTLGIGSSERPFVQLFGDDGKPTGMVEDASGQPVRVGLDAAALRQIAAITGGDYLALDPHHFGVDRLTQDLAGLERTQEQARIDYEPIDVARFVLVPAFLLLLGGACVRERRRKTKIASEAPPAPSDTGSTRVLAALLLLCFFPFVTGFDLFLRRDPNIEKGNQALAAGKADDALKAYDRAAEKRPDDPTVRFDRGAALFSLKRYPEAQKEFQRAAEAHDPGLRADAYYNMGNAEFEQKRYQDALEAYKRTLGLRPDDRRAKWNLELALKQIEEQKQQQKQQQQSQNQKDQKKQDQQSQQNQNQDQQKQDQQQQAQQDQQKQDQQKQDQQAAQDQQKQDQQKQDQQKQDQQQQAQQDQKKQDQPQKPKAASAEKEKPREIDKQDAEAVLDALERVEPTVQKDLARRRAGDRRPTKDW